MSRSSAALLALGTLMIAVWIGSYSRALQVRLPAREGACAASFTVYRGLTATMLICEHPTQRTASVALCDGSDRVRAACWDERIWAASYAGLSFGEGMTWLAGVDGASVARPYRGFTLPLWLFTLSCAFVPIARACRVLRMKQRQAYGCCGACGYDLRGLHIDCPACAARQSLFGESVQPA